ncbi:protein-tyrosine-phosphatase Etp [Escherichia coli]|uniref:protein-tyrosine-phosphatase Etp n=1 Tax=Escherichia coli TaxID=562 RepID=UPI0006A598E2|nr:protein-tyrosine-phosphatase Etp [Escherichia coli]EFC1352676.1 protein-tyrosine-phosphatase Etp [Escherichia coli]EFD8821541.1 protein-tyrosine-phosphatase Etp [Escherichia coli]QMN18185.1 protein-tyrosine-phosphatase Etp [Escherichia coli]HAM4491910.1 protein-tyrosine-phosphatase Etp [Escherichia coli]HAX2053513.1 protein-tyrosine-phosphatase Etp [Escherichia coli]
MAQLKFNSILVVCTGNICRSPIGERLLRKRLPGVKVKSAGVHGLVKHPADTVAAEVAANHGVSLDGHAGRKLTAEMVRNYDLILAMESEHIAQVTAIAPEVRGKTMLFGQWLEQKEIPDPYRKSQDAFEYVYGMLERASQEWAERLSR